MLLWRMQYLIFNFPWTTLWPGSRDPFKRCLHPPQTRDQAFTLISSFNLRTAQRGQDFWLTSTWRIQTRWYPEEGSSYNIPSHSNPALIQPQGMCVQGHMCEWVCLCVYVCVRQVGFPWVGIIMGCALPLPLLFKTVVLHFCYFPNKS